MEAFGSVVIGILGGLLLLLAAGQLKSGRAFQLGRGMGPETFYSRDTNPFQYWLHEGAVFVGGLAFLYVSLFVDLPLR